MCGIAGFFHPNRATEHPAEILRRMGAALTHRGPDDSGVFQEDQSGIGLAFRRLSIVDLSPEGHQPMISASGRHVIVFNGEVYNFEAIRSELGPREWRGHSDTEVILEALEGWGVEVATRRFVGMFAIALWDRLERSLYLVRDRIGIKPLYYGRAGNAFVFGSELKAIRQHPEFGAEIDRDSLTLYMRHSYVPSPHCIYKGLRQLNPGCILKVTSATTTPTMTRYWSSEEVAQNGRNSRFCSADSEAVDELERLLREAVRLRMIADVPLGAFLSGGVDSSTIVALMQAQSDRPVKTFTIGFHEAGYNEAVDAKRVAKHLGTEHTELYLAPKDAQDVIPLLPTMYDEPFADSSQIPTFLVSQLARRSVTVSLSGDGGDELFYGYPRYGRTLKTWKLMKSVPLSVRRVLASALRRMPPRRFDDAARILRSVLPRSLREGAAGDKAHKLADVLSLDGPKSLYYRSLSQWQIPSRVVLDAREPETVRQCIDRQFERGLMEDAMMTVDLVNYLPDDILTKVDRASMAVSLEARVPLLDHRVVEFASRLPLNCKFRQGTTKWILRQVLYKYVPIHLIERPKMGFGVPIDRWLRAELRDWAEDLLSVANLSRHDFLDAEIIREKWNEHLSGVRNWQYLLWTVLIFQAWWLNDCRSRVATNAGNASCDSRFANAIPA